MKKTVALVLSVLLIVALLAGCGQGKTEPSKLRVAATAVPHAEILEACAFWRETALHPFDSLPMSQPITIR